jgi:hypothetical protein
MTYNTDVTVTYHTDDIFFEYANKLDEDDKNFIRNAIYRQELLDIFELDDEDQLAEQIHILYQTIKANSYLKKCMTLFSVEDDEEMGLMIMYSFDYMHITHKCVCDFLRFGIISSDNVDLLQTMSTKQI